MADSIIIGAIKAILSLEDNGFKTGLEDAQTSVTKFKSASDQMVAGMSQAGKAATDSAKLIAGMSEAGKQAAAAAEQASTGFLGMSLSAGKLLALLGGTVAITKLVGEIIDLGAAAFESASRITDLASKSGLSIEAIQRMQFVAEQTGSSLDGFADAAYKLGIRLESGDKSVVSAVKALGLSLESLRAMKPDEQFELIVTRLGDVQDAQERNRLGVELFGKAFGNVAAAVAEGYLNLADKAKVSSAEQVKALDDAGDAWTRWKTNASNAITSAIGQLILWDEQRRKSDLSALGFGPAAQVGPAGVETPLPGNPFALAPEATEDLDKLIAMSDKETKAFIAATKEIVAHEKAIQSLIDKIGGGDAIQTAQNWTEAIERMAAAGVKLSPEDWDKYAKVVDTAVEAMKRGGQEIPAAWQTISNSVQTDKMLQGMRDLIGKTSEYIEINRQLPLILSDVAVAGETAMNALPFTATSSSVDLSPLFNYRDTIETASQDIADAIEKLKQLDLKKLEEHAQALDRLGNSFYELGQTIGGNAGAIVGNIGDMLHVLDGLGAIHIPDSVAGGLSAIAEGAINVWNATDSASTGINTMNGAIAGAMAGLSPQLVAATGGWSVAIGAAAGAITGLAKSAGNAKEELLASQDVLREWKDKVVEMFDATATGVQKLEAGTDATSKFVISIRDAYAELGHTAAETHDVLTRLAEAMNDGPDAVKRVLDEINGELERHEKIMQDWAAGVQTYTAGFVERVDGFRQALEGVTAATVETQAEFDRMGSFAITAFASILEQTGSAYAALEAIQAPMNQLIALQEELGFTGSATFARLADISAVVQANQDIFQSIEGLQQMMQGLDQATLMTKDDVVLFGQDATSLFEQLRARGVDANTAMALMQPTLQMLWEQQQKFHVEVDDATQALLDQAVAMGIVGAEHKSINQQILDALLAVEAAINRLPEAFANANAAAANLLNTLKAIGTAEGQMQVGLGASTGSGGVATSVTDVQNDLMTRWEQMYGTRDIPATVKHAQNEAFIAQGVEPPWPGFAKGGMVSDWLQSMYGPGAVPVVAHVGEGILNPFATAAIGGKSGLDAMNTNPWSAVQRMASMQMPSPTGTASAPMSSGGMTIGDINITVHAPGGDPQAVARATKSAFDEWYDEVESGRGASRYRRLHQQVVVT